MEKIMLIAHIVICVILVVLVLLQSGKEGMGVIFGGGSASVFGSTGAGSVLAKMTLFVATGFVITSLGYNLMIAQPVSPTKSVIEEISIESVIVPEKEGSPVNK